MLITIASNFEITQKRSVLTTDKYLLEYAINYHHIRTLACLLDYLLFTVSIVQYYACKNGVGYALFGVLKI